MPIPSLPSHASPIYSPQPLPPSQVISHYNLDHEAADSPPGTLLSPAFTPPVTPGTGTPALIREAHSVPVDTSNDPRPRLLDTLPEVRCIVRARIPISNDVETFLHLYQNNTDDKEHLAIVFGPNIRSTSLDAPVPGETEMDRMIRGAYTGRLYPGRTISRIDQQPIASRRSPPSNPIRNSPLAPPSPLTSTSSHSTSTSHPTQSIAMTAPLVRIHSECYTGENVGSVRCDCGDQLEEAKRLMSLPSSSGGGVVIYLRQEGRGIGLGAQGIQSAGPGQRHRRGESAAPPSRRREDLWARDRHAR